MQDFKTRPSRSLPKKRLMLQTLGALALLVVAGVSVRGTWSMYQKLTTATVGEQSAQAELTQLQSQEVQVGSSVTELSSERGIEEQIRDRFGLVKPGEGEIQIVTDAGPTTTATTSGNWLQKTIHALFGY